MKNDILPSKRAFHLSDFLWDLWCIVSVIGIWPRFIEPNMLSITKLCLPIKNLPKALQGFKIVQFSDLHFGRRCSSRFLKRITETVQGLKPDILVFTGDFLCYSSLEDEERLKEFLNTFEAPYGCYAIFGNHDYEESVSVNEAGDYDIIHNDSSLIGKGFSRLFSAPNLSGKVTEAAQAVKEHRVLENLLKHTPFQILNNQTHVVKIKNAFLNLTGLGEYMMGRCLPEKAFQGYQNDAPGIILTHNPDSIAKLKQYPGNIVLSGHTHGAQLNLPFIWKQFILMENTRFKRGLFKLPNIWMYVNRGVGSVMPFRWFSIPEILQLTLENSP